MTPEFLKKANELNSQINDLKHAISQLESFDFMKVDSLHVKKSENLRPFERFSSVYSDDLKKSIETYLEKKRELLIFQLKMTLEKKIEEFEKL